MHHNLHIATNIWYFHQYLSTCDSFYYNISTHAAIGGWLQGCIFCHGNCRKAITPWRAKKLHPLHHHKLLHIITVIRLKAFWFSCLRCLSAYNFIMCKGIKPSSQWLLPAHSSHFLSSCKPFNYSSLIISCLSLPHSSKYFLVPRHISC